MDKLKPCPFCGGEAAIRSTISGNRGSVHCYCKKCSSSTKSFDDYESDGSFFFKAIEAWNRRTKDE